MDTKSGISGITLQHYYTEQAARRGVFYKSLSEVTSPASDVWTKMTPQERAPFEKRAKDEKRGPQKEVEKFTSQGIALSTIEQQQRELENANRTMLRTIKEIVQNGFTNNCIGSQEFVFISGNYFIKKDDIYFPAEIAMVKFSFESGVISKFHTYVNPESLPMGYLNDAKEHSADTHQLPYPPNAKGEKNYTAVLNAMHSFLGNPSELPPLFTAKEEITIIKSFLQQFCPRDEPELVNRYRVYPLHQLFYEIKEEAVRNSVQGTPFKSIHIAEAHLNRDHYSYISNIACTYHEEMDCVKYCALASVQKWTLVFFDHICVDLNIRVEVGKHFPPEVDISHLSMADDNKNTNSGGAEALPSSETADLSSISTHQWGERSSIAEQDSSFSQDEHFPSLGSRRVGKPKKTSGHRDTNNPWITSASSSSSSNSREMTFENNTDVTSGRSNDRGYRHDDSTLDSTVLRGMGRGSALFRRECNFGRGRSAHSYK
ncbi:Protein maelstrom like [Pseudolycoriella hygida]|uniref:Protein maelstrom like n=1 Tax=Pseudolycoriella hygida TaxID=35572 RepID=A0A9Q0MKS2_9DIPT|nr:Protein maelstrom like [Pseudolycoriella hygida]